MNHLVITGGSKGIGWSISKKFLEMGWRVSSGSRSHVQSELNEYVNFSHRQTDVRESKSISDLLNSSAEQYGKIDCFINNSGYSEWRALGEITEEFLLDIFRTNLMGYFWGCQAAAKVLTRGDSIINISSLAARRGTANNSAYVASKFGVTGLTQSLAKELGPAGIRVNAICPVMIETDGLKTALQKKSSPAKGDFKTFLENFALEQTALGFLPSGEDIANACYFLSSSQARAITGQSISIDSGVFPN